jgi:hypothetical protein
MYIKLPFLHRGSGAWQGLLLPKETQKNGCFFKQPFLFFHTALAGSRVIIALVYFPGV